MRYRLAVPGVRCELLFAGMADTAADRITAATLVREKRNSGANFCIELFTLLTEMGVVETR